MNLNQRHIESVTHLVMASDQLIELDISWNKLRPKTVAGLFGGLKGNRFLEILNISWNKIQEGHTTLTGQD